MSSRAEKKRRRRAVVDDAVARLRALDRPDPWFGFKGTVTGRMSSGPPVLQQIPRSTIASNPQNPRDGLPGPIKGARYDLLILDDLP